MVLSSSSSMAGSRGRVLVVDEDPIWRLAIDRQLELLGWDVLTLNTGEEAIRVVERGFVVDVLLAELRLPDIDGRQVAWAICRLRPQVRVAFMTDGPPDAPLEPANAPLLAKPFTTRALGNAVDGAVAWPAPPRS
jgi:CheY-like chemotaxis protein